MLTLSRRELAAHIDHTLLKPEAGPAQIDRLCDEAVDLAFCAVCVNPIWVERCAARLRGTAVRVATVAGFPLGACTPAAKAFEAAESIRRGAHEVDMVVNLGALLAGELDLVRTDVAAVVAAVRTAGLAAASPKPPAATQPSQPHPSAMPLVKVILETRALSDGQIEAACRACVSAGADFVKTSTGFHPNGGATVEHVRLLKRAAAPLLVKASGGVRDLPAALAMIEAGANRIGASASVEIVTALPA